MAEQANGQPGFELQRDYDTSAAVPQGDKIISALPDWSGRIWFASKNGVVGTVDPVTGAVKSLDTKEPIGNSFAVDETGAVYIVTDAAPLPLRRRARRDAAGELADACERRASPSPARPRPAPARRRR